jgi:hypothetical protein
MEQKFEIRSTCLRVAASAKAGEIRNEIHWLLLPRAQNSLHWESQNSCHCEPEGRGNLALRLLRR